MYCRRTNLWQISCWRDEPISDSRYKEEVTVGDTSLANTYNYPGLFLSRRSFSQLVEEDGNIIHPATSDDTLRPGGDNAEGQRFSPTISEEGLEAGGLELGIASPEEVDQNWQQVFVQQDASDGERLGSPQIIGIDAGGQVSKDKDNPVSPMLPQHVQAAHTYSPYSSYVSSDPEDNSVCTTAPRMKRKRSDSPSLDSSITLVSFSTPSTSSEIREDQPSDSGTSSTITSPPRKKRRTKGPRLTVRKYARRDRDKNAAERRKAGGEASQVEARGLEPDLGTVIPKTTAKSPIALSPPVTVTKPKRTRGLGTKKSEGLKDRPKRTARSARLGKKGV